MSAGASAGGPGDASAAASGSGGDGSGGDGSIGAVVFDLDGVIYRGARLLDGAPRLLARLRAADVPVGFLTNGSVLGACGVRERCRALGLDLGDAPVVTAIDGVVRHLTSRFPGGATVLAIGAEALRAALFTTGPHRALTYGACPEAIDAVVVGLDPSFGYRDGAAAAAAIRAGAAFIATNLDTVRPGTYGLEPETGAIAAFVAAASGVEPTAVGKPSPLAFELAAEALGVPASRLLMVGDNLETDVKGAAAVGARSVLVLTGVADAAASRRADPQPTLTVADLPALERALPALGVPLRPHPAAVWSAAPTPP